MGMDEIMKEMSSARNLHVQQSPHLVEEHNGQHLQPFPWEEDRLERKGAFRKGEVDYVG